MDRPSRRAGGHADRVTLADDLGREWNANNLIRIA
jgi:hypothetical protein